MRKLLRHINRRDTHWTIQFVKYAIAGGTSAVFDIVIFTLLAWKVFPALKETEFVVTFFNLQIPDISVQLRTWYFVVDKTLAFMVSNFIAYVINIYWVFTPGRHSRRTEILLFYVISIVSFAVGTGLGAGLIYYFQFGGMMAYVANMVAAVSINYAGRKYIIFKG